MLPQYADGSKRGGKAGKKAKKKMSMLQCCILLLLFIWLGGVASYFYRRLEREHSPEAGGLVGLVLLGPKSVYGRAWKRHCEAFQAGVERRFPIPGWSDESVKEVGEYRQGQYLEQIKEREREIAKEVQMGLESFDPLAKARPIGAVAGEMGGVLEEAPFHAARSNSNLPAGSYRGSCDGCQLISKQLICARCKDGRGEVQEARIRIDSCGETEWIGNMNGRLACEPKPREAGVAFGGSEAVEKSRHAELPRSVVETKPQEAKPQDHAATEPVGADDPTEQKHKALPLDDVDLKLKDHIKLRDDSADSSASPGGSEKSPGKAAPAKEDSAPKNTNRKLLPARPLDSRWDPSKVAILITVLDPDDTQALKATLESLEKVPRYQEHDIFISQDVPNNRLNALVVKYQAKGMVMHVMLDLPKEPNMQLREARHVRKAVNQVLSTKGKRGQDFERVIVLDHDLEFSPSVLTFFETAAGVLNQDLSLFAVSAWNELGLPHFAGAESRMTRDSYFSGVAWMMHKADWAALDGDWPSDDVLREHGWVHWANDRAEAAGTHGGLAPDVALRWSVQGWDDAKRRDVAIPEVSRVKRSGGGAYDPEEAPLQRYSERVVLATSQPDATAFGDLSYMKEDAYEAALRAKIRNAKLLPGMSVPPMAATAVPTILQKTTWVLAYEPKQYAAVAKRLQIPERPMGQFKGATILTRKDSSVVILIDKTSPFGADLLADVGKDLHIRGK